MKTTYSPGQNLLKRLAEQGIDPQSIDWASYSDDISIEEWLKNEYHLNLQNLKEKVVYAKHIASFSEKDTKRAQAAVQQLPEFKRLIQLGAIIPKTDKELFKQYSEILQDKELLSKIMSELGKKIVGEDKTKLTIFIICCLIYVLNKQSLVNYMVNSESSAGKSYITKKIVEFFPKKCWEYKTKISKEAFTYWHCSKYEPEWTWDGKICYLEDIRNDVLNSETFKVMCSEGSCATIVKDCKAIDIEIKGKPVMLVTTASASMNNEIANRFNLVQLDESSEQTYEILQKQSKQAMDGELIEYDDDLMFALTYLSPINVKIPFADKLSSCFPIQNLRLRRDFPKFLDLIKSSCALHQYQRQYDGIYYSAQKEDYDIARQVMIHLQTNELMIVLPHKLKKAFECCQKMAEEYPNGFSAREIYTKHPIVSEKWWYVYLHNLSKEGLLTQQLQERTESKKPTTIYKPSKLGAYNLPKFEEL